MTNMLDKAKAIQGELSEWRRDFHSHPELGFNEKRTAAKVAEICRGMGLRVRTGVGKTGVVAELGKGKPIIAIRADMDALPILEANDVSYCSQTPGVMHACGHDAHTAMALGIARLLKDEKFIGTVRLVFQPSEETMDAELLSGAPRMLQDGALEGVDMILSQHVDPATPAGTIRISAGPASGGVDSWFAAIIGKGGHGAHPAATHDPIYMTAFVLQALYGIISRRIKPFDPAVVSVGAIHAGQAENVIPDRVELNGTLRYTEKRVHKQLKREIQRAFELVKTFGGRYELRFEGGTPPMQNHAGAVELIEAAGQELLGAKRVLPMEKDLGAEDFGVFLDAVPGAMFSLGTRIEGDEREGHNPRFDIDERALPVGTAVLAAAVLKYLSFA